MIRVRRTMPVRDQVERDNEARAALVNVFAERVSRCRRRSQASRQRWLPFVHRVWKGYFAVWLSLEKRACEEGCLLVECHVRRHFGQVVPESTHFIGRRRLYRYRLGRPRCASTHEIMGKVIYSLR